MLLLRKRHRIFVLKLLNFLLHFLIIYFILLFLGDRCISVISSVKTETRSQDSWRGLVSRVRHLLLVAYAKAVTRLEEYVRQQREKRNENGWDFIQYFYLQVKNLFDLKNHV